MNFVFDFGGVVFQWRPAELLRRTLPQRAASPAQARAWVDAFFQSYGGDWHEFDRGALAADEVRHRIAGRTALSEQEVQAVLDAIPAHLEPIPATVEWLRALKADGHRLFFISNMPLRYAEHLERAHDGVVGWFDDGVFSSRVQLCKPDPAIFSLALRRFGVAARDCVFLDDHLPNVDAARAAGWQALQFFDAAQAQAECRRCDWVRPLAASLGPAGGETS